ncbi:MAG: hypothetical protein ACLPXT_04030 [Terracidiphilus sp.]
MEFTTRITEQDYLMAYRLRTKSTSTTICFIIIYAFAALVAMRIISAFVVKYQNPQDLSAAQDFVAISINLMPILILTFFLTLFYYVFIPFNLRKKYRKTVHYREGIVQKLSTEGISETTSVGSFVSYSWSFCDYWRESRAVFVLILQSGIYFTYPKACLSAEQQNELRVILAAALPKK